MKRKFILAMTLSAFTVTAGILGTSAHGIYVADRIDQKALVLGEGPYDNAYKPEMVTQVDAYDTNFEPISIEVIPQTSNVAFKAPDNIGTTVTFFDYGHWTKDANGKMHHDKFENVPNAVKSTHAVKWNIHLWNSDVKPAFIYNVPIQIVPKVNPLTLKKGDKYEIQVFKDGKPMSEAPLINDVINDLTNESKTDKDGRAIIEVTANGLNVVGVEIGYPTEKKGQQVKYFSSLSFIINPE